MAYADVLSALADPTRRRVFERLKQGPRPVGAIARGMPVSRAAVSQHLKALKDAGLVANRQEGTRRVYFIDPQGLGALRRWLDQFWDEAFAAFQAEVELGKGRPGKNIQQFSDLTVLTGRTLLKAKKR
jgi:DNA-binding transcriptional ArsR family regulator